MLCMPGLKYQGAPTVCNYGGAAKYILDTFFLKLVALGRLFSWSIRNSVFADSIFQDSGLSDSGLSDSGISELKVLVDPFFCYIRNEPFYYLRPNSYNISQFQSKKN